MTAPSAPAAAAYERPQPPFPSQVVEEVMRAYLRMARAHQLYLPNNPMYAKALEQLQAAFAALWQRTDDIALVVSETTLVWEGAVVLEERDRSPDSLPWTCYKDGVRSLQLARGFETAEAVQFLDLLQRVRRAAPEEDDLLTLLWQGDFVHLRYSYVDLSLDGLPSFGTPLAERESSPESAATLAAAAEAPQAPGLVSLDDYSSTLYFLDEREIEYLRGAVDAEYRSDLRRNVLGILLDVFETQPDAGVRTELCEILESLLLHLLSAGQFRTVAYLLNEAREVPARSASLQPEIRQRLASLPAGVSDPTALGQLMQSLDEAADLPSGDDLAELFAQLRPTALGTLLGWLARTQKAQLRPLLERAVDRLASANVGELARVLGSDDRDAVSEGIRRAAGLKTAGVVPALAKLTADPDAAFRLSAVQALGDIGSPTALQAIELTVNDASRDVRVAAMRAIAARGYRLAVPRLEATIKGKAVHAADLTERMALFEAYGTLCGDDGVPMLDGLLNGRSMLGRREDPELRACAALALGRIGTPKAVASLEAAATERDAVVRNAVNRALRGGRA